MLKTSSNPKFHMKVMMHNADNCVAFVIDLRTFNIKSYVYTPSAKLYRDMTRQIITRTLRPCITKVVK